MAAIELVSGPAWQRVGWTLLHFVWQGAAVAALASLAVGFLRLGHGRARYAVYLVALSAMAACPALTFFALPAPAAAVEEVVAEPPSRPIVYVAARLSPEAEKARASGVISAEPTPPASEQPAGPGWRALVVGRLHLALPWIVGGWLVGVFVLSGRLMLGIAGSWRWRRGLKPLPESLGKRAAALASRLGLARRARVFVSSRAVQAIAVGWLRPMVLVPASFLSGMPPEVLEGVIAHELAHIVRRDLWVNLLQRVVETLLFYHPAVWWLSGRLRYERELCCDALAVGATGRQVAYAQALEWAGRAAVPPGRAAFAAGFARGRKALVGRVRHVLGLAPAGEYTHGGLAGLAGVAAVVLAVVAVAASQVLAGGAGDSSVYELPPEWPEFKAKKVSFADAGLEPLSTPELIQRLAQAESVMNHSIVKTETHTTWWNDYRDSTTVWRGRPMRDYSGKMEGHTEREIRLDLSGGRCAVRELGWGTAMVPLPERETFKPDPAYRSWLWDGTRHCFYGFSDLRPPGSAKIHEGLAFSERELYILGMEFGARGYHETSAGNVSLESLLLAARSVEPRGQLEQIAGSPCYVLDADTEYGKYVVWIDPAHGYNVARIEQTNRKGDVYGRQRLPWPENLQKTSSIETIRFEQLDDVWVPMEYETRYESTDPDSHRKTLVRHKRTEVKLNPDFDALGSFVPDDVKEGAEVEIHTAPNGPFGDKLVRGVWKDGTLVPSAEVDARIARREVAGVGDRVPDFTVKTLDGKRFRLSAHRGKVVLLHFCSVDSTCSVGLPGLKTWYESMERYRDHFAMISLNIRRDDALIRRQAQEYGLRWPQAQARDGDMPVATSNHGVAGVPAFIFVGPDGRIIPSDEESVMTILKNLTAGGGSGGSVTLSADSGAPAEDRTGDLAPDFTVKTLDGKEFRLSDHRGKVVLLHFWATWSRPSVADASRLKNKFEAMEDYRDHFEMISLSIDDEETAVRRHVEEHGLTWPHARVGPDSQIAADCGVKGVPAFIFIGPDGKISPSDETSVKTILKWVQAR